MTLHTTLRCVLRERTAELWCLYLKAELLSDFHGHIANPEPVSRSLCFGLDWHKVVQKLFSSNVRGTFCIENQWLCTSQKQTHTLKGTFQPTTLKPYYSASLSSLDSPPIKLQKSPSCHLYFCLHSSSDFLCLFASFSPPVFYSSTPFHFKIHMVILKQMRVRKWAIISLWTNCLWHSKAFIRAQHIAAVYNGCPAAKMEFVQ